MKHNWRYAIIGAGLILAVFLQIPASFLGQPLLQDDRDGRYPEIWDHVIADSMNQIGLDLIVDGKKIRSDKAEMFMTPGRSIMIPVSMLTKAFSCAVNFYDNARLVIEKNEIRIEMVLEQPAMTVNGIPMNLPEPLTWKGRELYIPAEAVESGLLYSSYWSVQENCLFMTAQNPDMKRLPYAYDYRKAGRAPLVKNQGTLGTCWGFASLTALESSLMPEECLDFSEDHMTLNNSFGQSQNDGGEYTMSMAYLLSWQGPVLEEEDPYGDGYSPEGLESVKHVQEIQILPSKDYEKIKEAIYYYGGVQSSLYTSLKDYRSRSVFYNHDKYAYCYIGTEKPNHDVVIVGWDDNYPRENFNMDLEGDGAFICVNSWGEKFGDDGYFYVSYYDTNIGIHNILYTKVEPSDNYDKIYQTDLCGWVGQLGYGQDTGYFANVYEAGENENLAAAGFYATGPDTEYEVFVSRNIRFSQDINNRVMVASGKVEFEGYYTIPFDKEIELGNQERFAVIVKIRTPGTVHPIAIEYDAGDGGGKVDISDGEGYISLGGTIWENVEEKQKCNLCLKAYTVNR